jgi:hypothetical protein
MDDDDGAFDGPAIKVMCSKIIDGVLKPQTTFVPSKVEILTTKITEEVLKELAVTNGEAAKNQAQKFKYVVTAHIQQNTGAGMFSVAQCYWDKATDQYVVTKWENETFQVIVSVFGVAIA